MDDSWEERPSGRPGPGTDVTLRFEGAAALLTLNRPATENRITASMWEWILDCLKVARQEASVRSLTIAGSGGVFSTGADLSQRLNFDGSRVASYDSLMATGLDAIREFPLPTLALVDGPCHGVGFAIALECDLRFATPWSSFSLPAVRQGFRIEDRTLRRLVSLVGVGKANDLVFSARKISGLEGATIGLVDRCLSEVDVERKSFLSDLRRGDAATIAKNREMIRRMADG